MGAWSLATGVCHPTYHALSPYHPPPSFTAQAFCYGFAEFSSAAWDLHNIDAPEDYTPLGVGAKVGIAILMAFVYTGFNLLRTDTQGLLNSFFMYFQLATTLVLFVAVAALGAKEPGVGRAPDSFVWAAYYNDTGFEGPGMELYVGLLGLLMSLFSQAGYEAGAHTAEETHDSAKSSPKGIIGTCVAVAACGFAYLLSLLYSIPGAGTLITDEMADPNSSSYVPGAEDYAGTDLGIFNVYLNGRTGNPVTDIFLAVAGKQGALVLVSIVSSGLRRTHSRWSIPSFVSASSAPRDPSYRPPFPSSYPMQILINLLGAGMASLTVTSRICYAMGAWNG